MAKEFIIGSAASSAIPVPATARGVSGQHVKITVSDHGRWQLEDLDSANGTYIKDFNGDFRRVSNRATLSLRIQAAQETPQRTGTTRGRSGSTQRPQHEGGEGSLSHSHGSLHRRTILYPRLEIRRQPQPVDFPRSHGHRTIGHRHVLRYRHQGRKATEAAPCQGDDLSQVRLPHSEFDIHNMQCTRCKAK